MELRSNIIISSKSDFVVDRQTNIYRLFQTMVYEDELICSNAAVHYPKKLKITTHKATLLSMGCFISVSTLFLSGTAHSPFQ